MRTHFRRTALATAMAMAFVAALAIPASAEPEFPTRICWVWEPEVICVEV